MRSPTSFSKREGYTSLTCTWCVWQLGNTLKINGVKGTPQKVHGDSMGTGGGGRGPGSPYHVSPKCSEFLNTVILQASSVTCS